MHFIYFCKGVNLKSRCYESNCKYNYGQYIRFESNGEGC